MCTLCVGFHACMCVCTEEHNRFIAQRAGDFIEMLFAFCASIRHRHRFARIFWGHSIYICTINNNKMLYRSFDSVPVAGSPSRFRLNNILPTSHWGFPKSLFQLRSAWKSYFHSLAMFQIVFTYNFYSTTLYC